MTTQQTKPVVRPVSGSPNTWKVTFGSHSGQVERKLTCQNVYGTPITRYVDTFTVFASDGTTYTWTLGDSKRTDAEALDHLLSYFRHVDETLVWCDSALNDGTIAKMSKKQEKALSDAMLALTRGTGLVAVNGHEGVFALVVAGLFVRYCGTERGYGRKVESRSYFVGDACVVSSYNLDYLGTVTKITDKFIWCQWDHINHGKTKRHTVDSFRVYNRRTVEDAQAHNAEERMYI